MKDLNLQAGENKRLYPPRTAQQFNGREGETATFLSTFFIKLNLRGGGFAPRHLKR